VRAFFLTLVLTAGCGSEAQDARATPDTHSRTEFTDRIENFFEYEPLRSNRVSRFRIHLTDLAEGTPVGGGEVALRLLSGSRTVAETRARPGSAAGIYVAELTPPARGDFYIELHVKTEAFDETMRLSGFSVSE
jgi:hypothetical protein